MHNKKLQLLGWILFKLSAIAFLIGSVGNTAATIGSALFLFACTFFILDLLKK
ncbi:cytochrome oxidase subunit III [Candidatus Pelagibacter sp. HIMB1517]|uniref:cytochrome oxidase subunit III n=1 Tax=Candidatus Pelagibacter sp. HIMB1517 TaxID=3413341 RepID=UPI003F840B02